MDLQAALTQICIILHVSCNVQHVIPELQTRQETIVPFRLPHHRGTLISTGGRKLDLGHRVPLIGKETGYNLGFLWTLVYKEWGGSGSLQRNFFFLTVAHFILFYNHPLMYPSLLRLKASKTWRLFLIHLGDLVTRIV